MNLENTLKPAKNYLFAIFSFCSFKRRLKSTVWKRLYIFSLFTTVICVFLFTKSTPIYGFWLKILFSIFTSWNSPSVNTLMGSLRNISNVFRISNFFIVLFLEFALCSWSFAFVTLSQFAQSTRFPDSFHSVRPQIR